MDRREWLAREFEEQRPHLRAVAYRMPGSLTDSDDAIQGSWLRLERTDGTIDDFGAWLTTVVGRICLDMLRALLSRGSPLAPLARPAMVNGSVGAIVGDPRRPIAVVAFTVANDRIVGIDLVANPPSVRRLDTDG